MRMVIQGREVPHVHMVIQMMDEVDQMLEALPPKHPLRERHEANLEKLSGELLQARRGDWSAK